MLKIGLISDTHNYLDPRIADYFAGMDEIWHAGDFGSPEIGDDLRQMAPLTGVYGNIDGSEIRSEFPLHQRFEKEGVDIWITHIGGNPGRYALPIKGSLEENPPDLFICGHTHILKIARDHEKQNMIYMNPGAAGRHGFHEFRTIVRFVLKERRVKDVEVINLGKRAETSVTAAK